MRKNNCNTTKNVNCGFTLIEVIIVVAIIGIISSVAFPSYKSYVTRAKRSEAMTLLTGIMTAQQRFATKNRTFTLNSADIGYPAPVMTQSGDYIITFSACTIGNLRRCVLLTATPPAGGRQVDDGPITINSRGEKQIKGVNGWNKK